MHSPAAAIAWEFRQRHRWGLAAVAGCLMVVAAVKLLFLASGQPIPLESPTQFAMVGVVPLGATSFYLLALFSFGFSGDLAARQSIYPARMFTLPVTSWALAGWPMLYGASAMTILWAAMRLFAPWPPGVAIPVVWPALLGAVALAWTQALTWLPYGLPGLRVVVAILWLTVMDTVVLLALHFEAREPVMLAILAPQVPLAYFVARFAVARARRGDVPDWRGLFVGLGRLADPGRRRERFDSPARAQLWFESRRHGRSLPVLVGLVLPFELALLLAAGDAPVLVFEILLGVLLTPLFMAAFAAATVRKANAGGGDDYGVTPHMATRPLTSAALIAAKLKMAFWSTLTAWVLVLVAIPVALYLTATGPVVIDRVRRIVEAVGTPRAVVFALLVSSALLSSTWKQLVQSLYVGLSGREWAVKASVFLALLFLAVVGPLALWFVEHGAMWTGLWDALPWILATLAGLKLAGAAWVAMRLYEERLVTDRTLVAGTACWLVVVLALHGLLAWLVDTPFIPSYLLLLVAILAIPLLRVSAAPLALAWNRHR
ncbi:MAG: hypothetical protein OEO20_16050 [Gemmatimonadota bacterium]|nr:hypothetical protein [Gemmatimonadota bacterium]MDH3368654.1 hypothetical protein [Gemmatimonadota bacterium]MDH3479810.1 hypothetical protein [Gemmatimonadota bacterium]MDH3569191.1 hypothetical protein [Gemmatimonadota bacterium]MDH5550560.1 hypothetical protein [Gemmatimonadota bacterium]